MILAKPPKPIRGIVFDKDGTLFDFNATWGAWAATVIQSETEGDTQRRDLLAQALGFDLTAKRFHPSSLAIASPARDIVVAGMPYLKETSIDVVLERWNALAAQAPQVEVTPLKPFLTKLRAAGLVVGVATNDAEAPARAHLAAVGVEDEFDFTFCEATGVAAQECLMVGDSTHDLEAGRAAGMTCVAVLTGVAEADELTPFADVVLPSVAQIPSWLGLDDG